MHGSRTLNVTVKIFYLIFYLIFDLIFYFIFFVNTQRVLLKNHGPRIDLLCLLFNENFAYHAKTQTRHQNASNEEKNWFYELQCCRILKLSVSSSSWLHCQNCIKLICMSCGFNNKHNDVCHRTGFTTNLLRGKFGKPVISRNAIFN